MDQSLAIMLQQLCYIKINFTVLVSYGLDGLCNIWPFYIENLPNNLKQW